MLKAVVLAPLAALALVLLLVGAFGPRRGVTKASAVVLAGAWGVGVLRVLGAPPLLAAAAAVGALYLGHLYLRTSPRSAVPPKLGS
jgi:hypothetical protein